MGGGLLRPSSYRDLITLAVVSGDHRALCKLLGVLEEEEVWQGWRRYTVPPNLMGCVSSTQLTPEEEEKRRVRRERNKLAAAKCRNRRRELTDRLQAVRVVPGVRACEGSTLPFSVPNLHCTCVLGSKAGVPYLELGTVWPHGVALGTHTDPCILCQLLGVPLHC